MNVSCFIVSVFVFPIMHSATKVKHKYFFSFYSACFVLISSYTEKLFFRIKLIVFMLFFSFLANLAK